MNCLFACSLRLMMKMKLIRERARWADLFVNLACLLILSTTRFDLLRLEAYKVWETYCVLYFCRTGDDRPIDRSLFLCNLRSYHQQENSMQIIFTSQSKWKLSVTEGLQFVRERWSPGINLDYSMEISICITQGEYSPLWILINKLNRFILTSIRG